MTRDAVFAKPGVEPLKEDVFAAGKNPGIHQLRRSAAWHRARWGGLFCTHVHLHGGPAPVRRYLPRLIELVLNGSLNPGKVFDLELPLEQAAEGYRAMDERRAIKTMLRTS